MGRGAHEVQPTQIDDCIGKEKSQRSAELPTCLIWGLQPSPAVPHAPPGSLTLQRHGENARDVSENPQESGHRTARGVQVLHEAPSSVPRPSDVNCILGSWAPSGAGPWQCSHIALALLDKGTSATGVKYEQEISTSQTTFKQVIWDWKFLFTPKLEIRHN